MARIQMGTARRLLIATLMFCCLLSTSCLSRGRCHDPKKPATARVAVLFWGLSRSLNHTLPFIEMHVLDVLETHGIAVDVFWHTVVSDSINSYRSGEFNIKLDKLDVAAMKPCKFFLADEETVSGREFDKYCEAKGWHKDTCSKTMAAGASDNPHNLWHYKFGTIRHLLCAYYTQRNVFDMINQRMQIHNFTYDAVLALRPDMAPVTDIDLPQHIKHIRRNSKTIWIPDYQHWNGINDRAAYGSVEVMKTYLVDRGVVYRDRRQVWMENSEAFLIGHLRKNSVQIAPSLFRSLRVRSNGAVARMDLNSTLMGIAESTNDFLQSCCRGGNALLVRDPKSCTLTPTENELSMKHQAYKTWG